MEMAMKRYLVLPAAALAVAGALTVGPVERSQAQDGQREVASYACRDVMRMSGEDRSIAVAFLHGYVLGSSGESAFDPEELRAATDLFIEYCLSNPDDVALDAMREATGS
jgi:hypothetical protein